MGKLLQVFQHQNWVRAGEHVALRVGSLLFSMVSAHAILWFYDSLAKVELKDDLRRVGRELLGPKGPHARVSDFPDDALAVVEVREHPGHAKQ